MMNNVYNLLNDIRKCPALYLGHPSVSLLEAFIHGYLYDKKESENYRDSNGQVKVQNTYKWKGSDGAYRNGAVCRDGKVTDLIRYVQKSSSSYSSSSNKYSSRSKSSSNNKLSQKKDEYDVYDYDDPEDFYYDHEDDFDEYGDAEDYWDEAQ